MLPIQCFLMCIHGYSQDISYKQENIVGCVPPACWPEAVLSMGVGKCCPRRDGAVHGAVQRIAVWCCQGVGDITGSDIIMQNGWSDRCEIPIKMAFQSKIVSLCEIPIKMAYNSKIVFTDGEGCRHMVMASSVSPPTSTIKVYCISCFNFCVIWTQYHSLQQSLNWLYLALSWMFQISIEKHSCFIWHTS